MSKKIFISGASQGIGLAIARSFYHRDFEVGICSRNESHLAAARAEMPGLQTFVCDMADKEAVKALAGELNERFGALDVLVNNAGIFLQGQIHTEADEVFEQVMATNVYSAYYLTKGVLPPMMAQRSGSIFNMCSVASVRSYPVGGTYGISKHALLGFSKNLREEMKEYGIRVMSLLPGAVRTPSWDAAGLPEERFIPAEDIGELVWDLYALSPRTVVEDLLVRPFLGDI